MLEKVDLGFDISNANRPKKSSKLVSKYLRVLKKFTNFPHILEVEKNSFQSGQTSQTACASS